jgi:hypothetical protein
MPKLHVSDWTKPEVDGECKKAHGRYDRALALNYTSYFERHPDLRGTHRHCAKDIGAALPIGWSTLADEIPVSERHRHHLSGKSSQLLGLGLLGVASRLDPGLGWLWQIIDVSPSPDSHHVHFEHRLKPADLHEEPRQTAIDLFVENSSTVVCAEIKWAEAGLGSCSCDKTDGDDGDPSIGECSKRILERRSYWNTAREIFQLAPRMPTAYCPISTAYQAVRNVAAARFLARGRKAVFLLIYDANNPYFRPTGEWPGWPGVLASTLAETDSFVFRAVAWQKVIGILPLDEQTTHWARDKHQLSP